MGERGRGGVRRKALWKNKDINAKQKGEEKRRGREAVWHRLVKSVDMGRV